MTIIMSGVCFVHTTINCTSTHIFIYKLIKCCDCNQYGFKSVTSLIGLILMFIIHHYNSQNLDFN